MTRKYKGKKILVVGLGVSGVAAANLLLRLGAEVAGADMKSKNELKESISKITKKITIIGNYKDNPVSESQLKKYSMVLASPGVPPDDRLLKMAREAGVEIKGELELGCELMPEGKRIIAVTGTNGKTTTVELIRRVLSSRKGRRIISCGNIGQAVTGCVRKITAMTDVVIEASSYQLETIRKFRPFISAILNISPDHIEHHGTMKNYVEAKARIFENQAVDDVCILNADDKYTPVLLKRAGCRKLMFSSTRALKKGIYLKDNNIICDTGFTRTSRYDLSEGFIKIPGRHNIENVMVTIAAADILGMDSRQIKKAINRFNGVEHRLEHVRSVKGITFINDSKSTNVLSCSVAIDAYKGDILLLMGGRDKGAPYTPLREKIKQKVKALVIYGEAAPLIKKDLKATTRLYETGCVKEAVELSYGLAKRGDTVLFSPACASFDQFRNYEHRGKVFKKWVREL